MDTQVSATEQEKRTSIPPLEQVRNAKDGKVTVDYKPKESDHSDESVAQEAMKDPHTGI